MVKKTRHITLVALVLLCFGAIELTAQSIRTEFGKNRIQYHDDFSKWWEYETENFIIYWYGKGRNIGESVVQIAEHVHPQIQNFVEHKINDKIEIIVYTDLSDLLQSNIGNEETFETKHESTKVIGSRMFVFFDGNHRNLQLRIKEGIAQVYLNAMYAPGGLQEIVDSDPDLKIPTWYREGFVSYSMDPWSSRIQDEMRDIWYQRDGHFRNFDKLANDHARVAGHSLWHYIADTYGRTSITTMLYLMRLRSNFNENLEFVFGFDEKKLRRDWLTYYKEYFKNEEGIYQPLSEDNRLDLGYKQWFPKTTYKLSPSGDAFIYTVNNSGKYEVILRDVRTGDQDVIFRYGSTNKVQQADYNYPIIAWHPTRAEVTIAYKHRQYIMLRKIDLRSGEHIEQDIPENFRRLYNIDYLSDEEYLFNGTTDGYSDLYTYRPRSRQSDEVTEDFYDDIDAQYVQLGEQWGVLFSSNRTSPAILPERLDTIMPTGHFDIFFLPLGSDFALQLTNTPDESEYQPKLVNDHYLTYLKEKDGITDRWVIDLNSRKKPYRSTLLDRNIINHEGTKESDVHIFQVYEDGGYKTYISQPNWDKAVVSSSTSVNTSIGIQTTEEETPSDVIDTTPVSTTFFQSRFSDPPVLEPLETNAKFKIFKRDFIRDFDEQLEDRPVERFNPSRAVASRRQFRLDDFVTRIDNEVLFEGLESLADGDNAVEVQETGLLIKGVVKDIFEDYKIETGVRIPTDFRGSEFFVVLDDRRKRIDKRFALYRKQRTEVISGFGDRMRELTWIGLHRWSYPFDTYRSVRATGQLRLDKNFVLHRDNATRDVPFLDEKRASVKLEYIFDNTLDIDLNLLNGTRYKFYLEAINRFDIEVGNDFRFDLSRGFTTVVGFDARHYIPALRHSVLALRSAGAVSFGSDRILYYVGGTDGWVNPRFEESTPVPANTTFAYKTVAPNLRGFDHNVRNGQSFFLASAEFRIPFIKYLSPRELKSNFLRNIQIVGFTDFGSAWHGILPNDDNSPAAQTTLVAPGVSVVLDLDRSIFAYSYGAGARISLLGYFIRADYARGIDGDVRTNMVHISLGTDF